MGSWLTKTVFQTQFHSNITDNSSLKPTMLWGLAFNLLLVIPQLGMTRHLYEEEFNQVNREEYGFGTATQVQEFQTIYQEFGVKSMGQPTGLCCCLGGDTK